MPLANLLNIPIDPEGWSYFSFSNQDEHRQIAAGLLAKGVRIQDYELDPIPLQNTGPWLYIHQASHNEFTQALGISGSDFTSVNLSDAGQVASWVRLHFQEHIEAARKLGLPSSG